MQFAHSDGGIALIVSRAPA